jgi:ABC-2 type transport system permease protein
MIASLERIVAVVLKEFGHVLADRPTLKATMVLPALQLLLYGYAINTVVDHIPTIVFDGSRDADSRALVAALRNSAYFDVVEQATSHEAAVAAIDAGRARAGVIIPPDYGSQVLRGNGAAAQLLVDGSDPNVAQAALFAAASIAQVHATDVRADLGRRLGLAEAPPGPALRPVVLYNPNMLTIAFVVPGLIGLILQQLAVNATAWAIVHEREVGTIEQLQITPIRGWELMVGKCIPYGCISLFAAALTLGLSRVIFGVEVAGSLVLLFALSLLFLLGSLGLGLLISTVAQTSWQARQLADLFLLPSMLLSGFLFPRETMPAVAQQLGLLMPLTYFLEVLRGVMLKGISLDLLWPQVLPLAAFAVLMFAASAMRFRKRSD